MNYQYEIRICTRTGVLLIIMSFFKREREVNAQLTYNTRICLAWGVIFTQYERLRKETKAKCATDRDTLNPRVLFFLFLFHLLRLIHKAFIYMYVHTTLPYPTLPYRTTRNSFVFSSTNFNTRPRTQ